MKKRQRKAKLKQRQFHMAEQSARLSATLQEIEAKAKRQRKGKKFIQSEMEKAGYVPNGDGGWRRLPIWRRESEIPELT